MGHHRPTSDTVYWLGTFVIFQGGRDHYSSGNLDLQTPTRPLDHHMYIYSDFQFGASQTDTTENDITRRFIDESS